MGHILNCEETATNTCIIMLHLSQAKLGNSASSFITKVAKRDVSKRRNDITVYTINTTNYSNY